MGRWCWKYEPTWTDEEYAYHAARGEVEVQLARRYPEEWQQLMQAEYDRQLARRLERDHQPSE